MKCLFIISIVVFLFNISTLGQLDDFICGTTESDLTKIGEIESITSSVPGLYIPSQGVYKILIVFARFKDDITSHYSWPSGGDPINFSSWIDPSPQTGSTHQINLTNYYKIMSHNSYNVIGQAVSVETPNNRVYYGNNYYLATKEVLQQKVDPLVNFAEYDNWTYQSTDPKHINNPDGTVDMIIMIWRGDPWVNLGWYGKADLGGNFLSDYTVEGGIKTIKTGFGGNYGSGVTSNWQGVHDSRYVFHAATHEVAHWLLGGNHPYGSGARYEFWGMLTSAGFPLCANAYERETLSWIKAGYPIINITGDITSAQIEDYITTGRIYKYQPPNGNSNEYFYFTNHQKLNIYDDITVNPNDKGIFIMHKGGVYNSQSNIIRVKTSNGQWDWSNPSNANCWGNEGLPSFKMNNVNRSGLTNRDQLPKSGGGNEWLFSYINQEGVAACGGWLHGEGMNNSFNTTYNDVFSPYSNPWSKTWSGSNNNFTMEITSQNGSNLYAKFYLTDPLAGKPSLPQQVVSSLNSSNKISTTWAPNLEPDTDNYKIYREIYYGSTTISEVHVQNLTTESYADDLTLPASLPNGVDLYVRYKVAAVDNTQKLSVKAIGNPVYLGRTFTGSFYPGGISQNYVFFGNVTINNNVAVGNNLVLWIAPNTNVSFNNNNSLNISSGSRIIAKGTSSQPITFKAVTSTTPGAWNSVTVQSSSNIFRYCIFKYAVYGLYLYNAYPGQTRIENCSFFSNSQNGIRLYHSNAYVKSSNIYSNNSYGIYCYNSSNLILNGTRINNNGNTGFHSLLNNYVSLYGTVIESNSGYGISADYNDNIQVGQIDFWYGYNTVRYNLGNEISAGTNGITNFEISYSSIHDNNGLEIYCHTTPGIYAYNSYWDVNGCQYGGYALFMELNTQVYLHGMDRQAYQEYLVKLMDQKTGITATGSLIRVFQNRKK